MESPIPTASPKAPSLQQLPDAPAALDHASLVGRLPVAVVVMDVAGRIVEANPAAELVLGRSLPELRALCWGDITHRDDRPACADAMGRLLEGRADAVSLQKRFVRPDGGPVWSTVSMAAVPDAGGTVRHVVVHVAEATGRLAAADAYRDARARLAVAFSDAPIGIAVVDPEGRYLEVNPLLCEMLGRSREELLELTWRALTHPDDLPADEEALLEALRCGSSRLTIEKRFVHRDGTPVWTRVNASVVRSPDGSPGASIVQIEDIGDRIRSEAFVREVEARLQAGFEGAAIGMSISDGSGRWLDVNSALCTMLGRSREELLATTWRELTHPDDLAEDNRLVARLVAGEIDAFTYAKRYLRPDGEVVFAEISVRLIRDDAGAPLYHIAQIQDVTERRRAEKALRESERRFTTMFESAPIGMSLHALDGRRVAANPALAGMTGWSRGELEGLGFHDLTLPEDVPAEQAQLRRLFDGAADRVVIERRARHRDGRTMTVEVTAAIIRSEHGEPLYVLEQVADIGERRHLEQQLQQASKLEAVGRLAGGVAHDFNNMLLVVRGYTHLLLQRLGEDDPARAEALEIDRAADRAAKLVGQLLAVGRRQVLVPRVLDLNEVVGQAESLLRRLVGEGITLHLDLEQGLEPVRADAGQLEQVIVNLVINSRDAMPDGGTLTMSTRTAAVRAQQTGSTVPPGRYALLTVRDTGTGMDPSTLARAFEPFFTTKAEGIGTGLGLATVHGIVTQMGGGVAIESEQGRGTVVRIHLPLAVSEPEEAPPPLPHAAGRIDGISIVVVEDDVESRSLVTRVLEAAGCTVAAFACPVEALAWLADGAPSVDVLLSDIVMPRMRGPELARHVLEQRPGIRVLLVSGYSDAELDGAGADMLGESVGFLAKPFTPRELVERVAAIAAPAGAAR